jgi:hypothetical protein
MGSNDVANQVVTKSHSFFRQFQIHLKKFNYIFLNSNSSICVKYIIIVQNSTMGQEHCFQHFSYISFGDMVDLYKKNPHKRKLKLNLLKIEFFVEKGLKSVLKELGGLKQKVLY